jgi:hypothetical protein
VTTLRGNGHEHELEPQHGLPERLPPGETLLWQGSPHFATLAAGAFHLRALALYFGVLVAWRALDVVADGGGALDVAAGLAWPLALSAVALAGVATLAWLSCRTTVYTITDRRVVMRIGIVLTLTFNLPYVAIASAGLRPRAGGRGDLALSIAGADRIAWLHLWPHVRPWRVARPEPMLRAVDDAARVAALLTEAWRAANAGAAQAAAASPTAGAAPAARPVPTGVGEADGAMPALRPSLG